MKQQKLFQLNKKKKKSIENRFRHLLNSNEDFHLETEDIEMAGNMIKMSITGQINETRNKFMTKWTLILKIFSSEAF